jgi:uncharacterized protein YraI
MVLATNVRSGPDGTAPVLRTVSAGTRLRVFTRLGSWLRVGDAEPWGWVHVSRTEDLVGTPSSGPPPATSTHTVAEPPRMPRNSEPASDAFTGHSGVVLLGANVRADPSADPPVLRTIGSGVYARVFARYGGWLQVGDSKPWGWVHVSRTKGLVDPLSLPAPPLAADGAQSEPLFPGKNAVPSEY